MVFLYIFFYILSITVVLRLSSLHAPPNIRDIMLSGDGDPQQRVLSRYQSKKMKIQLFYFNSLGIELTSVAFVVIFYHSRLYNILFFYQIYNCMHKI